METGVLQAHQAMVDEWDCKLGESPLVLSVPYEGFSFIPVLFRLGDKHELSDLPRSNGGYRPLGSAEIIRVYEHMRNEEDKKYLTRYNRKSMIETDLDVFDVQDHLDEFGHKLPGTSIVDGRGALTYGGHGIVKFWPDVIPVPGTASLITPNSVPLHLPYNGRKHGRSIPQEWNGAFGSIQKISWSNQTETSNGDDRHFDTPRALIWTHSPTHTRRLNVEAPTGAFRRNKSVEVPYVMLGMDTPVGDGSGGGGSGSNMPPVVGELKKKPRK